LSYRAATAHNNYLNDRQEGLKGKRKSQSSRGTTTERCRFRFALGYNEELGYYLSVGKGCSTHVGYIPDFTYQDQMSAKLVPRNVIE
jgi:hypothetical protein